ncbi:hypothetical protein D3C85_914590 [compost metagenome]
MIPKAVQRSASQALGSRPMASNTTFTIPNWSLNIQRTMMAAMTGAIINGSSSMVCTRLCPRNGRFSATARPSPKASDIATLENMNMKVLGNTILMKAGSVRTLM